MQNIPNMFYGILFIFIHPVQPRFIFPWMITLCFRFLVVATAQPQLKGFIVHHQCHTDTGTHGLPVCARLPGLWSPETNTEATWVTRPPLFAPLTKHCFSETAHSELHISFNVSCQPLSLPGKSANSMWREGEAREDNNQNQQTGIISFSIYKMALTLSWEKKYFNSAISCLVLSL